jgi:hypothetical protein
VASFKGDSGRWEVSRQPDTDRITVVFRGNISEDDGVGSARAFLVALGATPSVAITFDVRDVTGYSGHARAAWQKLLMPRRQQIREMTVVSRSRLTRMGASVFAMVMGIPCTVVAEPQG